MTETETTYRDFTIEVFHKGEPVHLVDLHENGKANACRRAINAIFLAALKDGREFRRGDLTAREFGTDDELTGVGA